MGSALWINAGAGGTPQYTSRQLRRSHALWLYPYNEVGTAGRLDARPGVRPAGSDPVALSGSTITVHPTAAVIAPRLTDDQGSYVVQIPSTAHALAPADTSNPRKDVVVVRVYDDDEDASGRREAVTEYIAGNPAASPAKPSAPPGAMELAVITVPADGTGSAALTVTAPYTVASGGILPVRDNTEYPTGGRYFGMPIWDQSTEQLKIRALGGWQTVAQTDRGFVTEDTDIIYGHGGASRSTQRRYWTRLTDKLVWCNWYVSFSSNGVGSSDLMLGAPTNIDRSNRQVIAGFLETTKWQGPTGRSVYAVAHTGGSGDRFDRVRWSGGASVAHVSNMVGSDVDATMLMMFSGIYREA